jgi:hypothetical protein
MALTLRESQLVTELAETLYDFLPGTPYPRANSDLSFPGAAAAARVSTPWSGGSKLPALTSLLSATLDRERHKFCGLITEIIRRAMPYRARKTPLTREEIDRVNALLLDIGFKVPELVAPSFVDGFPRKAPPQSTAPATAAPTIDRAALIHELTSLEAMDAQPRGVAFERFLNGLFLAFGLAPRGAFSLRGEQIDGSFTLDGATYLLEAKWKAERTGNRDLAAFDSQVAARATWARGLFVSYAGFSADGLEAFGRGRAPSIICMDAADIYVVLSEGVGLDEALRAKARRAAEESRAFVPVRELFPPR